MSVDFAPLNATFSHGTRVISGTGSSSYPMFLPSKNAGTPSTRFYGLEATVMSPRSEIDAEVDVEVPGHAADTAGAPLVIFAAGVLAAIVLVGLAGIAFGSIVRADVFLVGFALASLGLAYAIKRYRSARHSQ